MRIRTLLTTCAAGALLLTTPASAQNRGAKPNIVETAQDAGQFSTLLAAAKAADLVGALTGDGPLTVFAPTDDAFASLPKGTVEDLLKPENKDKLAAILLYHVVPGDVFASDAVRAEEAETLQGETVTFSIANGRLRVNESNVIANDIETSNGVIHIIDKVLLPENLPGDEPHGRLVIGVYTGSTSDALASQLRIDGDSFVISHVIKGSGAEKAGLKQYDVVVAINGEPYRQGDLNRAKEAAGYGRMIELTVVRNCKTRHIQVSVDIEEH